MEVLIVDREVSFSYYFCLYRNESSLKGWKECGTVFEEERSENRNGFHNGDRSEFRFCKNCRHFRN